jgi:hypothetical protein
MNPSNEFIRALYSAEPLEPNQHFELDSTCFGYRGAMIELSWTMKTTCPELSYPIVKLSKFATNPDTIHYDALYGIFQYFLEHAMTGLHTLVQRH